MLSFLKSDSIARCGLSSAQTHSRYFFFLSRLLASLTAVLMSFSASAAIVTFQLGDHPDGALYQSDPSSPYGLRLDDQPPAGAGPTFSVGTNLGGLGGPVTLTYDDADASVDAVIAGTLERNDDGTFWTVTYTLSGLTLDGSGGFTATSGSGVLTENGGPGSINLAGEQNGAGDAFVFAQDGHRLAPNFADVWVGRGWLLPNGSTDDWLVTATQIPLPAGIWLFASAMLGLVAAKKRAN